MKKQIVVAAVLAALATVAVSANAAGATMTGPVEGSFMFGSMNIGAANQNAATTNMLGQPLAAPTATLPVNSLTTGKKSQAVSVGGGSFGVGRVMSRTDSMHAIAAELTVQSVGVTSFGGVQFDYFYQPSLKHEIILVPHIGAAGKVGGTAGLDVMFGLDAQNYIRAGVNCLEKDVDGAKNYTTVGFVHSF